MNGQKVYCLLPLEMAAKLEGPLARHFASDPKIEVLVERRHTDRRRREERRARVDDGLDDGIEFDRRKVHNCEGRRAGERRSTQVPVSPPSTATMPRRVRGHDDQIVFAETLAPTAEQVEDLDTARLIVAFQQGDGEAFGTIYARYFDRVYTYVRVALADNHEAEDATQQVFMQVLESLHGYEVRSGAPFRAWLFRVVRNFTVNHLVKHSRVAVEEPESIERRRSHLSDDRDAKVLEWITDTDLLVLVERMPQAQRQVLMLRYMLGLSCPEVAAVLDRSPDAVRQLQQRALRFLRERLTALGRRPERATSRLTMAGFFQPSSVIMSRRLALR